MEKYTGHTQYLRVGDLKFDETYQRTDAVDRARVNDIAKNFDPAAVGVLLVSERQDGSLWVIDGMHRALGMIKAFGPDVRARCVVYVGMNLADEARAFWMQSKRTMVGPILQFRGRIASGDDKAELLSSLLAKYGLEVAKTKNDRDKKFKAISCAESMIRSHGADGFERILRIASSVGNDNGRAPDVFLLRSVEGLLLRFEINDDRLALVIGQLDLSLLRNRAQQMSRSLGNNLSYEFGAMALHAEYNKGRRNRLADFASTPKRKTIAPESN